MQIKYDPTLGNNTSTVRGGEIPTADVGPDPMTIHELRDEAGNVLHACDTASFPLPKDHWVYDKPVEPPIRNGELTRDILQEAMRYAIQVCTRCGTEDFDPDALCMTVENMLVNRVRDLKPRTNSILR